MAIATAMALTTVSPGVAVATPTTTATETFSNAAGSPAVPSPRAEALASLKNYVESLANDQSVVGTEAMQRLLVSAEEGSESGEVRFVVTGRTPDLDGDGHDDIIAADYRLSPGILAFRGTLTVTALRGVDAKPLWKRRFTMDESLSFVVFARVGKNGANGVVVQDLGIDASLRWRIGLTGVTNSGEVAWEHRFQADLSLPGGVARDVPQIPGYFDAVLGRATDILVGLTTFTGSDYGLMIAETRAVILDGSSGDLIEPAPTLSNWWLNPSPTQLDYQGDWVPAPLPAPDVSGDDKDDFVFVMSRPHHGGLASLRASPDGTELWSSEDVSIGTFNGVTGGTDLDGDDVEDLLLTTFLFEPASDDSLRIGNLLFALSGADGMTLWEVTGRGEQVGGGYAQVLGDIDANGSVDIGRSSAFISAEKSAAGIRYEAFDGLTGESVYSVSHSMRYGGGGGQLFTLFGGAGDLDADTIPDFHYYQQLKQEGIETQFASKMISGRTGRKIMDAGPWQPIGVSVDGHGADLVRVASDKDGARHQITTFDVDKRRAVWTMPFELGEKTIYISVDGGSFSADACNDVVVELFGTRGSILVAIDGRDGTLLWWRRLLGERGYGIKPRPPTRGSATCGPLSS